MNLPHDIYEVVLAHAVASGIQEALTSQIMMGFILV